MKNIIQNAKYTSSKIQNEILYIIANKVRQKGRKRVCSHN
jgi:hypothetical protein